MCIPHPSPSLCFPHPPSFFVLALSSISLSHLSSLSPLFSSLSLLSCVSLPVLLFSPSLSHFLLSPHFLFSSLRPMPLSRCLNSAMSLLLSRWTQLNVADLAPALFVCTALSSCTRPLHAHHPLHKFSFVFGPLMKTFRLPVLVPMWEFQLLHHHLRKATQLRACGHRFCPLRRLLWLWVEIWGKVGRYKQN